MRPQALTSESIDLFVMQWLTMKSDTELIERVLDLRSMVSVLLVSTPHKVVARLSVARMGSRRDAFESLFLIIFNRRQWIGRPECFLFRQIAANQLAFFVQILFLFFVVCYSTCTTTVSETDTNEIALRIHSVEVNDQRFSVLNVFTSKYCQWRLCFAAEYSREPIGDAFLSFSLLHQTRESLCLFLKFLFAVCLNRNTLIYLKIDISMIFHVQSTSSNGDCIEHKHWERERKSENDLLCIFSPISLTDMNRYLFHCSFVSLVFHSKINYFLLLIGVRVYNIFRFVAFSTNETTKTHFTSLHTHTHCTRFALAGVWDGPARVSKLCVHLLFIYLCARNTSSSACQRRWSSLMQCQAVGRICVRFYLFRRR